MLQCCYLFCFLFVLIWLDVLLFGRVIFSVWSDNNLRIEHACFDICLEQKEFAWIWGVWSTSKATCCTCSKCICVRLIIWTVPFCWKFMWCHFCLWNHFLWDGSFYIIFEIYELFVGWSVIHCGRKKKKPNSPAY